MKHKDTDKIIEEITTLQTKWEGTFTVDGIRMAKEIVENAPEADVVPKSEVENLKVLLEMQEKAYESLKELYDMDTEALITAREKAEVEVAREIFGEIEKIRMIERALYKRGVEGCYNSDSDYAELKKKYTEEKE